MRKKKTMVQLSKESLLNFVRNINPEDLTRKDLFGGSSLHKVFENGNIDMRVLRHLLEEKKVDMNDPDKLNNTPFLRLCYNPLLNLEMLKYTLEQKADLNAMAHGMKPFHAMCRYGTSLENIKYMVENKTDVNLEGSLNPLQSACMNPRPSLEMIKYLAENKANISQPSSTGSIQINPLQLICQNNMITLEIFKFLVESKAKINENNNTDEKTALHYLCSHTSNQLLEKMRFLIEKKAKVAVSDKKYNTPLHYLCSNGSATPDVIRFLIDSKSDCNHKNTDLNTPLHVACKRGKVEVLELLLEKKSSVNLLNKKKQSALYVAGYNRNAQAVKLLLLHKSDVNLGYTGRPGDSFLSTFFRKNWGWYRSDDLMYSFLLAGANIMFFDAYASRSPQDKNILTPFIEKYEEGSLWTTQTHKYLPYIYRDKVENFLRCIKFFAKSNRVIFPRPIAHIILQMFVELELKGISFPIPSSLDIEIIPPVVISNKRKISEKTTTKKNVNKKSKTEKK